MKKVAIHTIVSPNFGNRLQNYALYKTLESLGMDVYNVRFEHISLKPFIRHLIKKDKYTAFYEFNKRFKWTKECVNKDFYSKSLEKKFDAFIVGSDQIWNLTFDFLSDNSFLPFIKKKRKISYSASFGVDNLNDKLKSAITELNDYYALSVREDAAADYIESVLGKRPEIHVDPTMLLNLDEWKKIEKAPPKMNSNEQYLFMYFLGDISSDKKMFILDIARNNKLKIYNILDENSEIYNSGPSEFLYLISHASLIITDSFHASVFSILNKKPFVVLDRDSNDEKMNSRIVTLLSKFCLENKYIEDIKSFDQTTLFDCNFDSVSDILEQERKKALSYLSNSLLD